MNSDIVAKRDEKNQYFLNIDIKVKIVEKKGFEALMTADANLTNEYRTDYNAIKENIINKLNS